MSSTRERVPEVDVLRAWCCMAVLVMHVLAVVTPPDAGAQRFTAAGWLYQLLLWATPTFAVLSGFVLAHGRSDALPAREFYRRRMGGILLPFVAWCIVYLAIFGEATTPDQVALRLPLGLAGQRHLYFLGMVAQFYVVFPWIQPLIRRAPRNMFAASLLISLAWQAGFSYTRPPHGWETFWSTAHGLLPAWIVYLVAGGLIAQQYRGLLNWLHGRASWAPKAAVAGASLVLADFALATTGGPEFSSHRPLVIVVTLAVLPALWLLGRWAAGSAWLPSLRTIAGVSFGVYLVHPLALWITSLFVPASLVMFARVPLLVAGCAAVTAGILLLARLHPFSARLIGAPVLPVAEVVRVRWTLGRRAPNRADLEPHYQS